jgi:hypothetical protein
MSLHSSGAQHAMDGTGNGYFPAQQPHGRVCLFSACELDMFLKG